MTNAAKLTKTQFATAATVLALLALSETGEVTDYAARQGGARVDALGALVRKGFLTVRRGDFTMPTGPLAGQTITERFYSVNV